MISVEAMGERARSQSGEVEKRRISGDTPGGV